MAERYGSTEPQTGSDLQSNSSGNERTSSKTSGDQGRAFRPFVPQRSNHWLQRRPLPDMLEDLGSERRLPTLLEQMDEQAGETKQSQRPIDFRRVEIMNRLLELLSESSPSNIGVLQSTILAMFTNLFMTNMAVYFYTPDEIDNGCSTLPGCPLHTAIEVGVDDRLVVTIETFEAMLQEIPNFELARLLDAYTDYVQAMESAWQVMPLEKQLDIREKPRIQNAASIAVWGDYAYVADSSQHVILRVSMTTDEITHFCGMRGKPGFHDGPREAAKFNTPSGLAFCEGNSTLYVCDTGNDAIRYVGIPSGVVQTLSLTPVEGDVRLETPVGITIVRGDYEYDAAEDEDDEDEADDGNNSVTSSNFQEGDEDDDDECGGSRHVALLEGISEEDEDLVTESCRESFSHSIPGWDEGRSANRSSSNRNPPARYALANAEPSPGKVLGLVGRMHMPGSLKGSRRRFSSNTDNMSRRTSGYLSSNISRRTSGYMSSLSSRRTSTHFSVTPGESAKDSLKECTEEEEEIGYNLAVTGDHCIYLVKPEKCEFLVLAGSPSEYGYRDADKGLDARFSSLKGICCIRNCIFVADHWNNVIRCVNLKTRQVDTVIDFQPCGPSALTVSTSGSVYVLDSEYVSVCNILKICSLQCSNGEQEGVLGTTMFKMIQESIGRARSVLSSRDSIDSGFLEGMSRRGSFRQSRRGSAESDTLSNARSSRRQSAEEDAASRRASRRHSADNVGDRQIGSISNLGPRFPGNNLHPTNAVDPLQNMGAAAEMHQMMMAIPQQHPDQSRRASDMSALRTPQQKSVLPEVPRALRSLVPGASLHPALVQMTLRSRGPSHHQSIQTAFTGSQFRVSVVSSVPEDDFEDAPEFISFLNPKHDSPWKKIPIGTLQYVYQEATGQCSANTPLSLAYWDAADSDVSAAAMMRFPQQLLVGSAEWPTVVKVLPPRKGAPQDNGRFRAVAVDVDRVVMADSDSNQIFVVNHTKRSKHKIAGCGKAGYLDGPLDVCRMNHPSSIALDPTTHYIYVADSGNHRIRCIDLSTGFMSTVCGNGVKGNHDGGDLRQQSLDSPFDVHFMHPCHLLISCADNSIRRLDLQTKQLETVLVGS
mmetsp:Transcript_115451/g.200415  ORF Transcript_115451/g.200415 Transcript_115451/m.200415 type:complete len:1103 (+) Transcript_115451:58-3366(+)